MTGAPGVDYSSGHPGGAALAAAGMAFAARYVSHTDGKNISAAEAADLAAHRVSVVLVWETTANRAAAGRTAGIADAHEALSQATAAGMPPGRPLYFAVDWDADPTVVTGYFAGVASVLGVARTGVYGGYKVVKYLLDHKVAAWAWQTAAWSGGLWDPRAHIRQPATGIRINGVSCDHDTATTTDYGQWMPGQSPTPEDDMPSVDDVWNHTEPNHLTGKPVRMGTVLAWLDYERQQDRTVTTAQIGALTSTVKALAAALKAGGGLTVEQATAAAKAGADAALAELGQALGGQDAE